MASERVLCVIVNILEGLDKKEFGDIIVKRTTRKRKIESTPEFKKKIRTFEVVNTEECVEEETRMTNDPEIGDEDGLTDEERKLLMTKLDQKSMVNDLKKFIAESQTVASKKFEDAVTGLREELVKQNNELSAVRSDVSTMKSRIDIIERREAASEEAIDAKIRERERKREGRKRNEEKIKA